MVITTQDVLTASKTLGGTVEQEQALLQALIQRFPDNAPEAVEAINAAIDSGHLLRGPRGGIRLGPSSE